MYLYFFYVHVYICPLSVVWAKLPEIKILLIDKVFRTCRQVRGKGKGACVMLARSGPYPRIPARVGN